MRTRLGWKWATPAAIAFLLAVSSCGGDDPAPADRSDSETPSPTATVSADGPPEVFDGMVDVTPDRQLEVRCYGAGSPTVLLEVGGSGDIHDWPSNFVDALAAGTTTCLYSRAGGGSSTPVDGLLTRARLVKDAFTLLDSLGRDHGVQGPFVFVGWSLGGSVALAEALAHPELTAGLVILDSSFPSDYVPACIASGHPPKQCQATYEEDEEAKAMEKDLFAKVHPLPGIPIAVVSALEQSDCFLETGAKAVTVEIGGTDVTAPNCEALGVAIADLNRDQWGQLGPQVTDHRLDANHNGLPEQASAEISAIVLRMVTAAR